MYITVHHNRMKNFLTDFSISKFHIFVNKITFTCLYVIYSGRDRCWSIYNTVKELVLKYCKYLAWFWRLWISNHQQGPALFLHFPTIVNTFIIHNTNDIYTYSHKYYKWYIYQRYWVNSEDSCFYLVTCILFDCSANGCHCI